MSGGHEAQVLVALQDLDHMIKEAEDAGSRKALEEMGFPVDGLDNLQKAKEKLENQLPRALLTRYQRLSQRAGRAVVPVVDGVCTGCFTNVPAIFTSSVNRDKVIYCETCGRILFWP